MSKIVSTAVFGENHYKYAEYLPAYVLGMLNVFPRAEGWRLHASIDRRVQVSKWGEFLGRLLAERLVDVAVMPEAPLTKAMLWRMVPVFEERANTRFVFCRDLDAAPMPRDRACCDEFIAFSETKKLAVHTIHDSDQHVGVMGGLCGFNANLFREVSGLDSLEQLYRAAEATYGKPVPWEQHGQDQLALNRLILRSNGPRLFEHRYDGWHAGPRTKAFRFAGKYPCAGVSSPVPNEGGHRWCDKITTDVAEKADRLGNHLGCAGYDHQVAKRFWQIYGDPHVTAAVMLCEERALK